MASDRDSVARGLRGLHVHFDCFSGVAGDMTLGAMLDLGVPEAVVREQLGRLPVDGYHLEVRRAKRAGIEGCDVKVIVEGREHHGPHEHEHGHDHGHEHGHQHGGRHAHAHGRTYGEIRAMIERSALDTDVRARALEIFRRIGEAEGKLHGIPVEAVHFHEVGAIDSIVDVVGAATCLAYLSPARVTARRVPLGHGSVECQHGTMPVPSPAALEILRGAEVEDGGVEAELTTPTGAAILAASVDGYGDCPPLRVRAIGYGAGDRDLGARPNLLRILVGEPIAQADAREEVVVVEANIDDMQPELSAHLVEALLEAGALDAWLTPVVMKKGRPGVLVSALAPPALREAVERTFLRESTTIGVRTSAARRHVLPRRMVEVETPYGRIPVKVAEDGTGLHNAAPEYEACRRLARERGVPLKDVYAAALAAAVSLPAEPTSRQR